MGNSVVPNPLELWCNRPGRISKRDARTKRIEGRRPGSMLAQGIRSAALGYG